MYHVQTVSVNKYTIAKTLDEILQCNEMLSELYEGLKLVEVSVDSLAKDNPPCSCSEVAFFTLSRRLTGIWYLLYSCVSDFEAIQGQLTCQVNRLQVLLLEKELIQSCPLNDQ